MALKLEITQTPQGISLSSSSQTFAEQGGSIGRGENNTWILQDPDRFLSSQHCAISFEAGQYYLTDTSTNGTFFNGAPEPIGRGNRVALNAGDLFEVGDYKFSVSIEGEADQFAPAATPVDPFDVPASPFDVPAPPSNIPGDDFFSSSPSDAGDFGGDLTGSETDPLAALDKAAPQGDPFSIPADPFAEPTSSPAAESFPYGHNTFDDGSGDPLSASFEAPKVSTAGVIPEDWEDDDFFAGPAEPVSATPPPPPPRPKPTPPKPRPASIEPQRRDISQPNAVAPKRNKPKTAASRTPRPAEAESDGAQAKLGKLLVEAMGLETKGLSAADHIEISEMVGALMPVIVQGMMSVLRSRASIKNEFRMSVTTIQPVENNPLKFSADAQEALENMFVRKSKAYKEPVEAFTEGFEAIAEHQVAIIAGIRAAFESMLQHFNPEALELQFDKQAKGVSIPGMQKARYWSQYSDHYQSVIDNMEQSFQSLFGDEFVRAYEDQLFKLVSSRKKI